MCECVRYRAGYKTGNTVFYLCHLARSLIPILEEPAMISNPPRLHSLLPRRLGRLGRGASEDKVDTVGTLLGPLDALALSTGLTPAPSLALCAGLTGLTVPGDPASRAFSSTPALLSSCSTAKTIQAAHTTPATTLYEINTVLEASERQSPSAPLTMPSGMARRPVQRCKSDQTWRRRRTLKRWWWRMPQRGWRTRRARTMRPIMGWKLMELSWNCFAVSLLV